MKVLIEDDNGNHYIAREIDTIKADQGILIFKMNQLYRDKSELEKLESELSEKTGLKCIVLDSRFGNIYGV